jgi:hypothetical protein
VFKMSDKKEMPVSGGGRGKGMPDGVSGMPDSAEEGRVHGRLSGGESAGGAYPNSRLEGGSGSSGYPTHGGQSENDYSGGANPNATAGGPSQSDGEAAGDGGDNAPLREAHAVDIGGKQIEVVEDSGVAAAEASGSVATSKHNYNDRDNPGSG